MKISDDPHFEERSVDVVGLVVTRRRKAVNASLGYGNPTFAAARERTRSTSLSSWPANNGALMLRSPSKTCRILGHHEIED